MSNIEKTHAQKKGLGRGLGSLLGETSGLSTGSQTVENKTLKQNKDAEPIKEKHIATEPKREEIIPVEARIWSLPIEKVQPNKDQPRETFATEDLKDLAASIKSKGILQPIVVRKLGEKFQIIAGERRWRAAQMAGLHEIPAILRTSGDQETLELALIENIQRSDLNPIEEAQAYHELATKYNLSHSEIAERVGKERVTVTNAMRILSLDDDVQEMIVQKMLSQGHAKVLLGLESKAEQMRLAKLAINLKLSVRSLEKMVHKVKNPEPVKTPTDAEKNAHAITQTLIQSIEQELQRKIGTKVSIDYENSKGKVSMYFYSDDQLSDLAERLKAQWSK